MNIKLKTLIAAAVLVAFSALPLMAQNGYARQTPIDAVSITTGATSNFTVTAFSLGGNPAIANKTLTYETVLTGATGGSDGRTTNRVILAVANHDPSNGPWYTNVTLTIISTAGTNAATAVGSTNLFPYRYVRPVQVISDGTNTATLTLRLTQDRL